jgi:hypothetical protein
MFDNDDNTFVNRGLDVRNCSKAELALNERIISMLDDSKCVKNILEEFDMMLLLFNHSGSKYNTLLQVLLLLLIVVVFFLNIGCTLFILVFNCCVMLLMNPTTPSKISLSMLI